MLLYLVRNPPFAISHVSPEPIMEQSFVNATLGWAYKIVDFIVFPMGFAFDETTITVSYGKNDKDSWLLSLNRAGLLSSLVPVKTTVTGTSKYDPLSGAIERGTFQSNKSAVPSPGREKHHLHLHGGV